jgi:hypothetical protein
MISMRSLPHLFTLLLLGVIALTPLRQAQSQEQAKPATDDLQEKLKDLETLEELLAFLEEWDGDPDQLQAAYDALSPQQRQVIDQNFEFWSLEGGLGLGGGFEAPLSGEGDGRGLFRLSASLGALWPMGDYALPIYYANTDIPGPWAVGVQAFAQTDNFNTFAGGATAKLAWEYIGTSPYLELGPAFRAGSAVDASAGARFEVGYGNILLQGFLQADAWFTDGMPLTIVAGVRLPWLLLTLL